MAGFIYSQRQFEIYRFLERVGPCPLPAMEVLFGRKTYAALKSLRRAGYVYDIILNGIGFWVPQAHGYFNPMEQELIAWFAVRLEEKNGHYLSNDSCVTPNGTHLRLQPQDGFVLVVDDRNRRMKASLNDLRITSLNNCLKWNASNSF